MHKLNQKHLFNKFNISKAEYELTGLDWDALCIIYDDYLQIRPYYEPIALFIEQTLRQFPKVHVTRSRVKDGEHLIDKIIRQSIKKKRPFANKSNYKVKIQDLIGSRAIHLFKEEWPIINKRILKQWHVLGSPEAILRPEDPTEIHQVYEKMGCKVSFRNSGYRSVHYIIQVKPYKENIFAELQIRTPYEDAWGEVDHETRYPYYLKRKFLSSLTSNLSKLTSQADCISSAMYLVRQIEDVKENRITLKDSEAKGLSEKLRRVLNRISSYESHYCQSGKRERFKYFAHN